MWIEKLPNGKFKFKERYRDPITDKLRTVSLTVDKNTPSIRKEMPLLLQQKIDKKLSVIPTADMTFKEVADSWLKIYKETVKASTYSVTKHKTKMLNQHFGNVPITNITAPMVNEYFTAQLINRNNMYQTASLTLSYFKSIIKHAYKHYNIDNTKILHLIELPKVNLSTKDEFKYLEKEELKTLYDYLDKINRFELKRAVQIQVGTGLRFNELSALNISDIDINNNSIHVSKNYDHINRIFTTPKTGNERTIFFNNDTKNIILEQIQFSRLRKLKYQLRDNDLLFPSKKGNPIAITPTNEILKKVPIEKKISTHIFRHTFITLAIEAGMNKDLIAKQVGHTDTKMIDKVYAHFTRDMEEQQKGAILMLNFI